MSELLNRNIKVGVMVLTGLVLFILALYVIGAKQNLFGSTLKVKTIFKDVNGLTTGNNVRYMGITIGTVSDVFIINDSTVMVEMTIKKEANIYLKKNAITTIGTDGLMGNKLVNISAVKGKSAYIESGDVLESFSPMDMDKIVRTLTGTNDEINLISRNLKTFSDRLANDNNIWKLIDDPDLVNRVRASFINIEKTTLELSQVSGSLKKITGKIEHGDGLAATLLNDSTVVKDLRLTLSNLQTVSDSLTKLSGDMSQISSMVKQGKGAAGTILVDEQFDKDLNETMQHLKSASKSLDENMEALKHSVLLRKYFKKKNEEEE